MADQSCCLRRVGVAQPGGGRREQIFGVAHGAQPEAIAGTALGALNEAPVRAQAGLQLREQVELQQAGAQRRHGARHPVRAVVGADAHLGAVQHHLRLGRGGKLHAAVDRVGDRIQVEVVEADRQVGAQRHRSLAFGIRILRIDRGQVEHVGRAEEVAHAPGNRVLAAAQEQRVADREVREQLLDSDDVVEFARRLRIGIGGERIAQVDLAEHTEVVRRAGVQEHGRAQVHGSAVRVRLQRRIGQVGQRRPARFPGQREAVRAADLDGRRSGRHGGSVGRRRLRDQHVAAEQIGGVEPTVLRAVVRAVGFLIGRAEQRLLVGADRLRDRHACRQDQNEQDRRRQPARPHARRHRLARSTYALLNTVSGIAASDRSVMLIRVFLPATSSSTKIISVGTTALPTRA